MISNFRNPYHGWRALTTRCGEKVFFQFRLEFSGKVAYYSEGQGFEVCLLNLERRHEKSDSFQDKL